MEKKFKISDVNISVLSHGLLHENEKWRRFSVNCSQVQISYRIHCGENLPPAEGKTLFEDGRVRCFEENGIACRAYLKNPQEAYCLVRETSPNAWDIYTRAQEKNWGSDVSHYFDMFDLTHALLPYGVLLLHCAYILTHRGAILFTAPSGTGKSTQAALWEKHRGAKTVNGDRAALRCKDGALWVHGLPISGSSESCENISAPVLAVVGLSQAKENSLTRLTGRRGLQELLQGIYHLPEHMDELPVIFEKAAEMVKNTPIYHLACLPEASAVELLDAALKDSVLPNV